MMGEAEVFVGVFAFEGGEEVDVLFKPAVPFEESGFGDAELFGNACEAEALGAELDEFSLGLVECMLS